MTKFDAPFIACIGLAAGAYLWVTGQGVLALIIFLISIVVFLGYICTPRTTRMPTRRTTWRELDSDD